MSNARSPYFLRMRCAVTALRLAVRAVALAPVVAPALAAQSAVAAPTGSVESALTSVATASDLDRLVGSGWTGTLTYRDYTTEARTTIKAALLFTRSSTVGDEAARWDFRIAYADEPHANSGEIVSLAPDGRWFRGARVVERTVLANGTVRITTEQEGRDNDRAAAIRLVYTIGERSASLQKLVRYEGGVYFERHIYEWTR